MELPPAQSSNKASSSLPAASNSNNHQQTASNQEKSWSVSSLETSFGPACLKACAVGHIQTYNIWLVCTVIKVYTIFTIFDSTFTCGIKRTRSRLQYSSWYSIYFTPRGTFGEIYNIDGALHCSFTKDCTAWLPYNKEWHPCLLHQVLQGKSKGLAWRDFQTTGNAQLAACWSYSGELNSAHLHLIDETKGSSWWISQSSGHTHLKV